MKAVRSQVGIAHEEEGRVVVFEDGRAELLGGKHLHPAAGARDETTKKKAVRSANRARSLPGEDGD
jgi:hypothetical protein